MARWSLRAGLLLACAAAALDPALPAGRAGRVRVVVLDVSASLGRGKPLRRGWVLDALADLDASRDRAGLLLAGAAPRLAIPPCPPERVLERLDAALLLLPSGHGSDLGAALLEAAAAGATEVYLLSDGRDTSGRLSAAAQALGAAGIPVHALAPELPPPFGAGLVRLVAPAEAAPGERVRVLAEARAWRRTAVAARLLLEREGAPATVLAALERELEPGDPLLLLAETPPLRAGQWRVRAEVRTSGTDDDAEDDARAAWIRVGERARALLAGAAPELAGVAGERVAPGELAQALAREGALPDLVVLGELTAPELAPAVSGLRRALAAGAGLVVLGAERSFGPGRFAGSELESLLPVGSGPGEERQRPLALVVALDGSGSMKGGERSRWDRALESGLPFELLRPGDALGVVVFAATAELVVPPGPPDPGVRDRLKAPGGETDVGAGLLRALEGLVGREGELLALVVSDAEDPQPSRHAAAIRAAAAALPAERLAVLLVRIAGEGAPPAPAYAELAAAVGPAARVVELADADGALRELVEGELLARRASVRRGAFELLLTPEGRARKLAAGRVALYAPVRAREGTLALLRARDPELEDPPVAVLGRSGAGAVLALPLPPAEAAPLLAPLLGELLPSRARGVSLSARRRGEALELLARGPGLGPGSRVVVEEGGSAGSRALELVAEGPDGARGWLDPAPPDPLALRLVDPAGATLAAALVEGAEAAELLAVGPEWAALERTAALSGGSVLHAPPGPERPLPRREGELAPRRAGALLAGLALVLLLVEAASARPVR